MDGERTAMSPAQHLDSIYLINVRSFTDRLKHARAQLARFNLQAELVHEWDADDLTDEIDKRYFASSDLSPAQKSCSMKHVTALQRIVDRGERFALVLEDDVLFEDGFSEGLKAALAETSRHPWPQVIFIGSGGNFYTPRSQRKPGQRLYSSSRGRFADSYIIGHDAARLRLDWIVRHRINKSIDSQFEEIDPVMGITMLWLEDPIVKQGSKTGLFTTTLEPAHPNWLQRLLFWLEKFRRKYVYQIWR
ncbi:MAG: glycosyltransferase family 25 protein [Proteobacteria bacterium]|nr:glycosyltransferase family 25 protein [Pseudomonadota bacterium]